MIEFIRNKANDEKYFGSVKYFYHNLISDNKHKFILILARYNIYLAAQCIMTSQRDEVIEEKLIEIAERNARDFNNSDKSAKGFLALAEFEKFTLIAKLLKEVQKPAKSYTYIFKKIFENNKSQEIFLQLLEIILSINKINLISNCISTYSGDIQLTNENRQVINKMFDFLIENKYYGITKSILDKYDLFKDIALIFNKQPIDMVKDLLYTSFKKLRAIKLSYEIYNRFNLVEQLDANVFVEELVKINSDRAILVALTISKRQNIRNISLDNSIINLFNPKKNHPRVINRVRRRVSQFISKGVIEYILSNDDLKRELSKFEDLQGYKFDFVKNPIGIETMIFSESEYSIYEDHIKIPLDKPINQIIREYFDMINKPSLEILVNMLIFHFGKSFMEVSHLLRPYLFTGKVEAVFDYGYYVQPKELITKNLLFLHKHQYLEDNSKKPEVGEVIQFRIIGINQQNFRFNISCLSKFAI